jgi:hypothetical protein
MCDFHSLLNSFCEEKEVKREPESRVSEPHNHKEPNHLNKNACCSSNNSLQIEQALYIFVTQQFLPRLVSFRIDVDSDWLSLVYKIEYIGLRKLAELLHMG